MKIQYMSQSYIRNPAELYRYFSISIEKRVVIHNSFAEPSQGSLRTFTCKLPADCCTEGLWQNILRVQSLPRVGTGNTFQHSVQLRSNFAQSWVQLHLKFLGYELHIVTEGLGE